MSNFKIQEVSIAPSSDAHERSVVRELINWKNPLANTPF